MSPLRGMRRFDCCLFSSSLQSVNSYCFSSSIFLANCTDYYSPFCIKRQGKRAPLILKQHAFSCSRLHFGIPRRKDYCHGSRDVRTFTDASCSSAAATPELAVTCWFSFKQTRAMCNLLMTQHQHVPKEHVDYIYSSTSLAFASTNLWSDEQQPTPQRTNSKRGATTGAHPHRTRSLFYPAFTRGRSLV